MWYLAGTPLRVQVDGTSFPKRIGDLVHARLTRPVCAFDKEVLPADTAVIGHIFGFSETPRMQRFQTMMGGHFGSFKMPEVKFDTLLPAGAAPRAIATETSPSTGQVLEMRARTTQRRGVVGFTLSKGKQEIATRIKTAKTFLRSPHKREAFRHAVLDALPYHLAKIGSGSTF